VQEANFRSFDLLIAAVFPAARHRPPASPELLARAKLLKDFARQERCSADRISFYPVELKSDEDSIDERLPNQIIDAILTFGLSILVLDENHSRKAKSSNLNRVLPATIVCYTGVDDHFEMISVFDRFVSCGVFDFERMNLARMLLKNTGCTSSKAQRRLALLQQILQKIVFSQLHFENAGLTPQEQQFISALAEISLPNQKKMLADMIKETTNAKLTDYA
jgi:hypothetical protein